MNNLGVYSDFHEVIVGINKTFKTTGAHNEPLYTERGARSR
jgi:hypothetical protein